MVYIVTLLSFLCLCQVYILFFDPAHPTQNSPKLDHYANPSCFYFYQQVFAFQISDVLEPGKALCQADKKSLFKLLASYLSCALHLANQIKGNTLRSSSLKMISRYNFLWLTLSFHCKAPLHMLNNVLPLFCYLILVQNFSIIISSVGYLKQNQWSILTFYVVFLWHSSVCIKLVLLSMV